MAASTNKKDKRKQMIRIVAIVLAGIMVLSVVLAAVLSQVW